MARVEIRSEVAGIVSRIEKRAGDAVADGEPIIILESMKMEIPVESSTAGKLESLAVAEGDVVEEGQVLCRILA